MAERPRPTSQRTARPSAPATVSLARAVAFALLQRVATTSAHSDDLLHGPALVPLSQVDRDLVTALVLGVLRWQIALDSRILPLLNRPDAELPLAALLALRLGAFQLLHMERIPAHAALNESVELVRGAGQPQAAGMVNAVLRRLAGAPSTRKPLIESLAAMAERLGHPDWLVEGWVEQYGRPAAEQICAFDQNEPPCTPLFTPNQADAELPVMDAGSRLVAELAAAAAPRAVKVWDCCAAPGGKILVLRHRLPSASLLATDRSPKRLERLQQRLARHAKAEDAPVEAVLADAAALPKTYGLFDLILCDVPCSGTGTLARNPEIRHRLYGEELVRQVQRQKDLLGAALRRLVPGGRLLYSTCSLEAEECEAVVTAALEQPGHGCVQLPLEPYMQGLVDAGLLPAESHYERWLRGDFLRTLPGANFAGDGFFAALFKRD